MMELESSLMAVMLPGVMSGAIISWITAINELSNSIILFTGATKTMSVAIYTEVIRASYGTAAALSTILTVTTITAMVLFFKVSGRREMCIRDRQKSWRQSRCRRPTSS